MQVWLAGTDSTNNESFRALGNLKMTPAFADLRALTAAANCSDWQSQLISGADMSCDLYGRVGDLGYPPFSVATLSIFGATESSTNAIGLAIATLFLCLTWRIFFSNREGSPLSAAVLSITLAGFPTLLALERMNIDILIFILLFAVSLVIESSNTSKHHSKAYQTAKNLIVFLISASLVSWKIYPIFGLATLAVVKTPSTTGIKKSTWIAMIIGSVAGLAAVFPWLQIGETIPRPGLGIISHGLIGTEPSELLCAALVIGSILWIASRISKPPSLDHGFWQQKAKIIRTIPSQYLSCTATWLLCFLLTRNYDYRIIFIYPAIAYICQQNGMSRRLGLIRIAALTLFGALAFAPLLYFPLHNMNLGVADLMKLPNGRSVLAFLRLSGWWIGRAMDLGGTALMAASIISIMMHGRASERKE